MAVTSSTLSIFLYFSMIAFLFGKKETPRHSKFPTVTLTPVIPGQGVTSPGAHGCDLLCVSDRTGRRSQNSPCRWQCQRHPEHTVPSVRPGISMNVLKTALRTVLISTECILTLSPMSCALTHDYSTMWVFRVVTLIRRRSSKRGLFFCADTVVDELHKSN